MTHMEEEVTLEIRERYLTWHGEIGNTGPEFPPPNKKGGA